jgi:hypothetical protein
MTQTRSKRKRRSGSAGIRTHLRQLLANVPMIIAVVSLITPLDNAHTPGVEFRRTDGGSGYFTGLQWCPPVIATLFSPAVAKPRGPSPGLRKLQAREIRALVTNALPEAPETLAPPSEPLLVVDLPPPPPPERPFIPEDILPPLPAPPPVIGGLIPPDITVAEPPAWLLLGLGLAGVMAAHSRRRKALKA